MYHAPDCDNRTISEELPKLENYIPMIIAISEAFTIQQTDVPHLSCSPNRSMGPSSKGQFKEVKTLIQSDDSLVSVMANLGCQLN